MLYWMCKKSRSRPLTWPQMKHAIMRNFGGLKSEEVDPFQEFCKQLNMAEEEPDPEKYVNDQEVVNICSYVIIYLYHRDGNIHHEKNFSPLSPPAQVVKFYLVVFLSDVMISVKIYSTEYLPCMHALGVKQLVLSVYCRHHKIAR